jgi:hypothetical protein
MSINIEYNCDSINLFEGINLQLINGENKLIISSISAEDSKELIPGNLYIVIQMALPNIELMCILNLSLFSAEIIGKRVFCQMFSFDELITCQYVDEIKFLSCVQKLITDEEEYLLLDKFLVFCSTIAHLVRPLIGKDPELLKSVFKDAFELII